MCPRIRPLLLSILAGLIGAPAPAAASPPELARRLDQDGNLLPAGAVARLGTARFRMPAFAWELNWETKLSPDGTLLAVLDSSDTADILFLDPLTGRQMRRITGIGKEPSNLTFSPTGKTIATISTGTLSIWSVATGRELGKLPLDKDFGRFHFSGDGKSLVIVPEVKGPALPLTVYDTATGNKLARICLKQVDRLHVSLSHDGKRLVTWARPSRAVQLWDVKTGKESATIRLAERGGQALRATFSPDGKVVAVSREEGAISFFDVGTGKLIRSMQGREGIGHHLQYSPDGKLLVAGDADGKFMVWDTRTGKRLSAADKPNGKVLSLAFCAEGRVLALGAYFQALVIWDVMTGKVLTPGGGHDSAPTALAFDPDGRRIHAAHGDGAITTWALTGKELTRWRRPSSCDPRQTLAFTTHAFSPRLNYLATADWLSSNTRVVAWKEGQEVLSFSASSPGVLRGHAIAFSPNGVHFAVATGSSIKKNVVGPGSRIRRWALASNEELPTIEFANHFLDDMAFSPNGQYLAVTIHRFSPISRDERLLRLYHTTSGKEVLTFKPVRPPGDWRSALAYAHDGRHLVIATGEGALRFLDPLTGAFVKQLSVGHLSGQPVFSPDGRTVLVATDGGVALWELSTGRKRWQHPAGRAGVAALTFSPDGKMFASAHYDTTVLVWDVTGRLLAPPNQRLAPVESARLWRALNAVEGEVSYFAMRTLASAPRDAVALFRKNVQPVGGKGLDGASTARLVRQLSDDDFKTRERAEAQLEKLGEDAVAALWTALEGKPDLELAQRAKRLLAKLEKPFLAPDRARPVRVIEVLEWIDSADARALLEELARGGSGAALAREAKKALERRKRAIGKAE